MVLFFGGAGVPVLVYAGKRFGRVRFAPSDWHRGFWKTGVPTIMIARVGGSYDDPSAPPEHAGSMQCAFSVEIFNSKSVATLLQNIAAEFHLPDGSTYSAKIYDPQVGHDLNSLALPAKEPVRKELLINVSIHDEDVDRELMVKLADTGEWMLKRLLIIAVVAALMVGVVVVDAFAQSVGCTNNEDVYPCPQVRELREFLLPEGYTHEGQVWVYEFGGYGDVGGLYDLMSLCYTNGGYYYYYEDGYYWHPCSYQPGDLPSIND